jgi:hypothetical protein
MQLCILLVEVIESSVGIAVEEPYDLALARRVKHEAAAGYVSVACAARLYQRVEKVGPGLVENIEDRLRSTTARGIPPTVEEQLDVKMHILGGVGDVM